MRRTNREENLRQLHERLAHIEAAIRSLERFQEIRARRLRLVAKSEVKSLRYWASVA